MRFFFTFSGVNERNGDVTPTTSKLQNLRGRGVMLAVVERILYFLTGLATGIQLWYSESQFIWGAPINPLHYVAFAGSVGLLIAAFTARREQFPLAAIIGVILLWSFYFPFLYKFAYNPPLAFRFDESYVFSPLCMLIASTAFVCWRRFRWSRVSQSKL
jgi:hypothetical protein